jgi:hypothetical protein
MAFGSVSAVFSSQLQAALRKRAKPAPQTIRRFKHFLHELSSLGVALRMNCASVLNFYLTPLLLNLGNQHINALQNIHRLKAADRTRLTVSIYHLLIGLGPNYGGYVARAYEAIDTHFFTGQKCIKCGRQQLVR